MGASLRKAQEDDSAAGRIVGESCPLVPVSETATTTVEVRKAVAPPPLKAAPCRQPQQQVPQPIPKFDWCCHAPLQVQPTHMVDWDSRVAMQNQAKEAALKRSGRLSLDEQLPELPEELLRNYHTCSTPSPLEELCPLDFTIAEWSSFDEEAEEWLRPRELQQPLELCISTGEFHMLLSRLAQVFDDQEFNLLRRQIGSHFGHPELLLGQLEKPDFYPRIVGVMAADLSQLVYLASRVYTYMQNTGATYGVISSWKQTVFCKSMLSGGGLLLSAPMEAPLKGLAFLIGIASKPYAEFELPLPPVDMPLPPASFDWKPILARITQIGARLKLDVHKFMAQLRNFPGVMELQKAERIRWNSETTSTVMKGEYRGKLVVVKTRDLSSNWRCDCDTKLTAAMQEVHAYGKLAKLQGTHIPTLLCYGFMRGATIFYQMMSDESPDQSPGLYDRLRAIPRAFDVLNEVHRCGVSTDGYSSIIFSRIAGEVDYTAKLANFSRAKDLPEDPGARALVMRDDREVMEDVYLN